MANTKKKKKAADADAQRDEESTEQARPAPDSAEELARVRKRNTIITSAFVAVTFAAIGFVSWHRPRDPGRVWFKGIEQRHRERLAPKLTRCFGGDNAAAIRVNLAEVRRGSLPAVLRGCRGGALSEVMALPLAVAGDMGAAPGYAETARLRVWESYSRLAMALRAYERATNAMPETGTSVPEANRDALASAIDDVATDADAARNAVNDLRNVVEENASWY
jgi:hypothetical protein